MNFIRKKNEILLLSYGYADDKEHYFCDFVTSSVGGAVHKSPIGEG